MTEPVSPTIPKLTKSLFPKRKLNASLSDVSINEATTMIACTVNIKPNKIMNRRRWKTHTADQQRASLTRLEQAFRKVTPACKLMKLTFEKCPSNGHIHFHAMYEAPAIFMTTIENFWNEKVDGNDLNTRIPWRHVIVKNVFNQQGWIDYITKYESQPKSPLDNNNIILQ